jgi:hypothetical protein
VFLVSIGSSAVGMSHDVGISNAIAQPQAILIMGKQSLVTLATWRFLAF